MSVGTAEKIYKEVKELKKETNSLRELIFLILKDPEGEYRDSFVKEVSKKSRSKPLFVFKNKTEFLKQISS